MSFFGDVMEFFAGGEKPKVQQPQVATTKEELAVSETGRTMPQSEAENEAIRQKEEEERDRQRAKQGQGSTVLTGSLGAQEDEDSAASQRKTLLGA